AEPEVNMLGYRKFRQNLRLSLALAGAGLVCGCSGAVHQLPQISKDNLSLALAEVQNAGGRPPRHTISDDEGLDTRGCALGRIGRSADQVCREMNTGVCEWDIRASADRRMNANARPNGRIEIKRGIFEYADNQEQIAMVIAHEIGHQAANHMERNRRKQVTGQLVGAILLGAVGAAVSHGHRDSAFVTRTAMNAGAGVGGYVGGIAYSKEQEREADYLSAVILYRAGVDLDKARGFLVKLSRASRHKETGMLDTHPAGPDRIAGGDQAVQQLRASNGQLPARK